MEWQFLEWYNGCPIEHRPGMQRRRYRVIYRTESRCVSMVHFTADKCRYHIDRLHKKLGDKVNVTEQEYYDYSNA